MEKNELQLFRSECIAAHNFFRAAHGTPPLGWSSRLAESAQSWAEQLAICGAVRNSSEKEHGENVASLWGSELTGQKVTRIWYEEARHFNYDKPRFSSRTRSFCQVIWEGSREFGVGAAVTKHGKKIVVARYFPAANKKDVAKKVKKPRITQTNDDQRIRAFDTRWSRLYLGLKQFQEECLEAHNDYRLRHGAAPVRWSASLAWEAQQWAEELARNGELRHNDDDTVGENLAGMLGGELTGREVVDMWYDEIENYDFDNPRYDENTSNFTQVVWVASETLGVGRAVEGDLCVAVAFYEPPGNMEGVFGENVLRMGSTVVVRKDRQTKGFVPPPPDLDNFRIECLVTHNYYRARHGSPPLVLNGALTDEAQYWAERLLVTGASEDFDNSHIGICVAVLDKNNVSGIKVSEQWYKEILNYDFDSPGFSNQTRDFTQLVWFSSRKFGVGKASSDEGVTVVVARYEPVGNMDGLFVQNVKRRGHERGSSEPMIFHVDLRYRMRTDSKSSNSFLSWENEGTQTFGEIEKDLTTTSDLEQFDENQNIVHRTDNWENQPALPVNDHFTRLVWIDPQSPILQRKGITKQETDQEGEEKAKDVVTEEYDSETSWDQEDARTADEQENRDSPMDDLTLVIEEPSIYAKEAELENAVVYSDPEDDISEHIYETRHSLYLDSEGFEPEMQKGNVLNKVAFFETFQQSFSGRSPSSSGSSHRRSFVQEEPPELSPLSEGNVAPYEEEERECQLEYEDVFPAHREEEVEEEDMGVEGDENIYENEGEEDEEESLVSVSDTEDTLDFTDHSDQIGERETQSQYENFCVTHEFKEEDPNDLEICDGDDEDDAVLRQYPDVTEEERKTISITKHVILPVNLGTATEIQNAEGFSLCKDDPPDLIEDAPFNYNEEYFKTSAAEVQIPFSASQKTPDSDCLCIAVRREDFDTRLKELSCRAELLSPTEDNEGELHSFDLLDFNGTEEGKLLLDIYNNRLVGEMKSQQCPIEEVCEKAFKDEVLTEIDIEELYAKLDRDEKQQEVEQELSEIEKRASIEDVEFTRPHPTFERSVVMEKTVDQTGFVFVDESDKAERKSVHREEVIEIEEATSENLEEDTIIREKTLERLSSPTNLANEGRNSDRLEEIDVIEQIGEEKSTSLFSEEETFVEEAKFQRPSSPRHITDERINSDVEEGEVFEPIENEKMVSLFLEEDTLVDEAVLERSSSPRYITNEAKNSDVTEEIEFFEQIQEEKRPSLFVEEDAVLEEKRLERPLSPRHITSEAQYSDFVEEVEEAEPVEEEKRASLFLEEETFVDETTLKGPSSPRHLANEAENSFQQEDIEDTELVEGAALEILNVDTTADKAALQSPSSPQHVAGDVSNIELLKETAVVEDAGILEISQEFEELEDEINFTRFSYDELQSTTADKAALQSPSSPQHVAGDVSNIELLKETAVVEDAGILEISQEFEELEDEINFTRFSYDELQSSGNHVAGDISSSNLLEAAEEYGSPELDCVDQFVELEGLSRAENFQEASQVTHVAGEVTESGILSEVYEDVIHLEASLECDEDQDYVTTTNTLEMDKTALHVAGEVLNVEPKEESSEEETPGEGGSAEMIEEIEIQTTSVAFTSPQSLLRIAADALELNIDTIQQDLDETSQILVDKVEKYSEEHLVHVSTLELEDSPSSYSETEIATEQVHGLNNEEATAAVQVSDLSRGLPVVVVKTAGEVPMNRGDEICLDQEIIQEHEKEETDEMYQQTRILDLSEGLISQSNVAGDITSSENYEEEVTRETDTPEQIDESENASFSEETCKHPLELHISSELRDEDFKSNGDAHTQAQCATTYEASDYVSEERLPSFYITEKPTPSDGYKENEEAADEKESAQVYNHDKQVSRTEIPLVVLQPPLEMAAELSDSDFGEGVEVELLNDGDFSEEFVVMEEVVKQEAILEPISDSISIAAEVVSSGPRIVKEENDDFVDETDSAQEYNGQENPIVTECHSTLESSMIVAGDIEHPDHQEHSIQEETQRLESANQHNEPKDIAVVEYTAEIYGSPVCEAEEFSQQYNTEIKSDNGESSSSVNFTGSPDECDDVEAGEEGDLQTYDVTDVKGPVFENVSVRSTSNASSEVEHRVTVVEREHTFVELEPSQSEVQRTEATSFNRIHHDDKRTVDEKQAEFDKSHAFGKILTIHTVNELSPTSFHIATEITSYEGQYKTSRVNGADVHYIEMPGEVDRIHEVHVKSFQVGGEKMIPAKKENGRRFETTAEAELNEGILEKEVEDQEEERLAKELSIEETEVRLMKNEITEQRAVQHVIPLVQTSASEERETSMKGLLAKSMQTEDSAGAQQSRDDSAVHILKEDEASLEEESAAEQIETQIEIMRLDEALSEVEFRGEAVETTRRHPTDSEPDDSKQHCIRDEVVDVEHKKDTETNASDRSDSLYEEEVEIEEVQPIYEEEFEIQRVREEKHPKPSVSKVGESVYEEEIEVVAVAAPDEPDQEHLEEERKKEEMKEEEGEHRLQSSLREKKVEVSAHTGLDVFRQADEPKTDGSTVVSSSVFEEELDIGTCEVSSEGEESNKERKTLVTDDSEIERAVSKGDKEREGSSVSETVEDNGPEGGIENVQKKGIHNLQDGQQLELYEDEGTVRTRYYVEVSSSESLEPTSEVAEDEPSYPETYVRQGDPLEENLEEFILVRYGDEFESSGEEEVGDLREIYVIPEEDNDIDEHHSRGGHHTLEELEGVKERSCYEQEYETVGLEEIRESPEFDMDDSPDEELDVEEQRQLEEYERLESFVILEEKLSQVESDEDVDEDLAALQVDEGDENVFHSDVCSSSEETLQSEELGETMTYSMLRDAVVAGEDAAQEKKLPSDDDGHEQQTKTLRQSEGPSSQKSEKREIEISEEEGHPQVIPQGDPIQVPDEDNNENKFPTSVEEDKKIHRSDEDNSKASAERYSEESDIKEDSSDDKDPTQVIKKTEDKADHSPSSDSSGEQSVSSGGSLSSIPSVDLEGLDDFQQDCLLQHNMYRRQHRTRPLVWSDELALGAKEWAEHLACANSLEHTEVKGVGENLASVQGKELTGSEIAEMWYREATDYNFEVPAFNAKCGNFTNVVWASSREFGVAKSVSDDGTHYVVARYKPMGNVVGEFKENVKPPREASSRLKRRRSSARRRARAGVPPFTPAEREKFMNECVISHNYYRTFHGAPALRWSPLLAAEAQNYAERLAKTESVTHSGQKDRGENLAYTWDAPLSAPQAIDMWYDEVQQYDFDCPGFTSETAHFTQLVWIGTEDFGMGMAVASDGRNIIVGRYFPPGNIVGQFQDNVRPREIGTL